MVADEDAFGEIADQVRNDGDSNADQVRNDGDSDADQVRKDVI
jgi:hypothetical protein